MKNFPNVLPNQRLELQHFPLTILRFFNNIEDDHKPGGNHGEEN